MESLYTIKYLTENLITRKFGDDPTRITESLYRSKISLTPHQIQASLFPFKSPVSKGVMLCDEVGLGKTIEAGIVITQYWCEHKRNILIIVPAALARQWASELEEKFNLPSVVMDRKYYNSMIKKGVINPFENKKQILIMSVNFARNFADEIEKSKIDLVIIDEAHKLRNVYNQKAILSNNILKATKQFKKILLTATPLQNNLMELYGLSMLIDDSIFGDINYFKDHFIKNYDLNKKELRERLGIFIHRTLRNQVEKYVKYSKRITHTFNFEPSLEEQKLYDKITELIFTNPKFGTKRGQSWLISMILRKLLSSSTSAVMSTLYTIKKRLENLINNGTEDDISDFIDSDEFLEDFIDSDELDENIDDALDMAKCRNELRLINEAIEIGSNIKDDKKAFKLLEGIEYLFSQCDTSRNKKILIFTESRRTQDYLFDFLNRHGYTNTVLFNGGNSDPKTKDIYNSWIANPENSSKINNSKSTNIRSAILDYFKNTADIMIATEAGAEGLNIQFCSMMVNYDLPWNPQRVEQRIGRCHRFGQKNDVIVINFLNSNNKIDSRVYELLLTKFKLFDDVFGSSDEVLGKLDSEVNFEKSIYEIYSTCRTPEEIDNAFNKLQDKFKLDISNEMKKTQDLLINNFDEDLQNIFDDLLVSTENKIKNIDYLFWRLCKFAFNLDNDSYKFNVTNNYLGLQNGSYVVSSSDRKIINLHYDDTNGTKIINYCKNLCPTGTAIFDITNYPYKIKEIEEIKNKSGIIVFGKVIIDSFETEEYLILQGRLSDGTYLENELCEKLFRLSSFDKEWNYENNELIELIKDDFNATVNSITNKSLNRNNQLLKEEIDKIDSWANDKIQGIELKVEILREQRKQLQRDADYSTNSLEKIKLQKEIQDISKKIKNMWLQLAKNEDIIEEQRNKIVEKLKKESMRKVSSLQYFYMPFEVR